MFVIPYTVTEEDYYRFSCHHAFTSRQGRRTLLTAQILLPVLLALIALAAAASDPAFLAVKLGALAAISVLWVVFAKRRMRRAIRKNLRRLKKSGRLPYSGSGTLTFGESEIAETGETGESRVPYSLVEKLDATDGGVYVYVGAMQAVLLPNACFADAAQRDALLAFLREKTGKTPVFTRE